MEKILKTLRPAMLRYMRTRYDEAEVARRWQSIETRFAKWKQENGDLGGAKNPMSRDLLLCYAMCAFYEALDRDFSREDYMAFVDDAMKTPFAILRHFNMNRLENNRVVMGIIYACLRWYSRNAAKKYGKSWGNPCLMRVNPDGRMKGFAFVLDTCPLYEFAVKYGYTDFLPNMCAVDPYLAKQFRAHLIRHKTLSDGDGACEYWYVGDLSREAICDSGSK